MSLLNSIAKELDVQDQVIIKCNGKIVVGYNKHEIEWGDEMASVVNVYHEYANDDGSLNDSSTNSEFNSHREIHDWKQDGYQGRWNNAAEAYTMSCADHCACIDRMIREYREKKYTPTPITRTKDKEHRNTSTSAIFNSGRIRIASKFKPIQNYKKFKEDILNDDSIDAMVGLRMEMEYRPLEKKSKRGIRRMLEDAIFRLIEQCPWIERDPIYLIRDELSSDILHWASTDKRYYQSLRNEIKIKFNPDVRYFYNLIWYTKPVILKLFSPYLTEEEIMKLYDVKTENFFDDGPDLYARSTWSY